MLMCEGEGCDGVGDNGAATPPEASGVEASPLEEMLVWEVHLYVFLSFFWYLTYGSEKIVCGLLLSGWEAMSLWNITITIFIVTPSTDAIAHSSWSTNWQENTSQGYGPHILPDLPRNPFLSWT